MVTREKRFDESKSAMRSTSDRAEASPSSSPELRLVSTQRLNDVTLVHTGTLTQKTSKFNRVCVDLYGSGAYRQKLGSGGIP